MSGGECNILYDLHFPSVSLLFAPYDDTYLAQRAMDFWDGVLDGGCGPTWPSTLSFVDNLCWNRDLDLKSCV